MSDSIIFPDGECTEAASSPEHQEGVLVCTLPQGHDGPHHDTFDHVHWEGPDGDLRYWPESKAAS